MQHVVMVAQGLESMSVVSYRNTNRDHVWTCLRENSTSYLQRLPPVLVY
jgi:hypothetical protein